MNIYNILLGTIRKRNSKKRNLVFYGSMTVNNFIVRRWKRLKMYWNKIIFSQKMKTHGLLFCWQWITISWHIKMSFSRKKFKSSYAQNIRDYQLSTISLSPNNLSASLSPPSTTSKTSATNTTSGPSSTKTTPISKWLSSMTPRLIKISKQLLNGWKIIPFRRK